MPSKLSIILIFSNIISFLYAETCQQFTCGILDGKNCTKNTSTNTTESFVLQKCADTEQCPFQNYESQPLLECEDKMVHNLLLFPGGPCGNNTDCFSNNCTAKVCVGTPIGGKCSKNKECPYEHTCRTNSTANETQCLPQLESGVCEKDTDCVNSMGCLTGTCTAYFTLNDNTTVPSPAVFAPLSFCKSGWDYEGKCATWKNVGGPSPVCSDEVDCVYTDSFGQNFTLPEKCFCGYNPTGLKHCELASGEANYTRFVDKLKGLLTNTTLCHTEERGGFCNYQLKFASSASLELSQNLTNSRILANFQHQLVGADSCVIDVVYPEFNKSQENPPSPPTPPTPESNQTCAVYECKKKQGNCAQSSFFNDTISVILSDICNDGEYCNVGGKPDVVFYDHKNITGSCKGYDYYGSKLRFAGEDCDNTTVCFTSGSFVGECQSGKCFGKNETQTCAATYECNSGLYCNTNTTTPSNITCTKQLGDGANCTRTNECQNKYTCFNGTCQNKWYSQPIGTNVTSKGDLAAEFYCVFGEAVDGVCTSLNTTATPDAKTGVIECKSGSQCSYTRGQFGLVNKTCECGYNSEGKAYCQLDTDKWTDLWSKTGKLFDNSCHSEGRYNCYKNENSNSAKDLRDAKHSTFDSHLLYNAVPCAQKVLSSTTYGVSIALLMLIIAFLF